MNAVKAPAADPVCPRESMSRLVGQLGHAIFRAFNGIAKPAGLRAVHLRVLMELSAGERTQHDLAESLDIEPTRLVVLLNDLDSGGYIERRRDPEDRRRHIVVLAPACPERLAAMQTEVTAMDERFFGVLDAAEREQLFALLRRVSEAQPASETRDGC